MMLQTLNDLIMIAWVAFCSFCVGFGILMFFINRKYPKHPCKGCKYHVESSNQCTFNPIYGEPVPEQCTREGWSV